MGLSKLKDRNTRITLTYAFRQGFVPLSGRLTGQHGRSEQVIPRVAVVENHGAEGKVPVLYFTLPDGVGWDAWIGAIDHYTHRETQRRTHTNTQEER